MEDILFTLRSVNVDPEVFMKSALILSLGSLLLGSAGRFMFGKKSAFSHAVSSAIGIVFIYAAAVVVYSCFPQFKVYIPPLPYAQFNSTSLVLFSFQESHYTLICSQVLNMIILAFLANLLDNGIPASKNIFLWLLSKCAAVAGAIALQLLVNWLLGKCLPQGLLTYAPTILLGVLILLVLVGALKLLVGAVLSTFHPLIGAFYTFFFATVVGRAVTKAILTTGILTGAVLALNYVGCTVVSIASAALIAYLPFLILLALVWYLINRSL